MTTTNEACRNHVASLTAIAALVTLSACASPASYDAHVTREPMPYVDLSRSPVVRNAPARTAPRPAVSGTPVAAVVPTPGPRAVTPPPTYWPTRRQGGPPVLPGMGHLQPTPTPRPVAVAPQPAAGPRDGSVSRPVTSVPVVMDRVTAPTVSVVSRSTIVPAPRVTGTVGDASRLTEFEAYDRWVVEEYSELTIERRALQGLMSAHHRYESEPSPQSRELLTEKADHLREVARIARSIDAGSSRSSVEAIESEVAAQANDLADRRRDVQRVITAIQSYQRSATTASKESLLNALRRYSGGGR